MGNFLQVLGGAASGFLLSGGVGWNFNEWGPSCLSIEAARVVTADGNLVVASEQENPDLLWAIRGAGARFFGIVTEYTLRLYAAPGAIRTSNYYYPLELVGELGRWVAGVARELPKQVELTIFLSAAPASLADHCSASNGWACIVSGTAFAQSVDAAAAMLKLIDNCPLATHCLRVEANLATPIETLHEMNKLSTPPMHRYLVDTLWTNSPPASVLTTCHAHFIEAPSVKSIALFTFLTGSEPSTLPDVAYSMRGEGLLICSAIWERPEDDGDNAAWHRATIAGLDKYASGHYIGESDIIVDPSRAERSFSSTSWQRLNELREKYDPAGLFHADFSLPHS